MKSIVLCDVISCSPLNITDVSKVNIAYDIRVKKRARNLRDAEIYFLLQTNFLVCSFSNYVDMSDISPKRRFASNVLNGVVNQKIEICATIL
jgi:hypothetical protein